MDPSHPSPGSRSSGAASGASEGERAAYLLVEQALDRPSPERAGFLERELATLIPSAEESSEALALALQLLRTCDAFESACADDREVSVRIDAAAFAEAELAASRRPRLREGARLAHFTVRRFVAAGGMGEVYEAVDERVQRRVAIKVLPSFASPERVQRFPREAMLMARVDHPAIARLYEWGTASGVESAGAPLSYIAMEFIEGEPLADASARLRAGAPGDAVPIVELLLPIVDAVAHAHARGVLHRDIKPANILVDATGRARLLDFGVASVLEKDEQLAITASGDLVKPGTLAYMSPEQIRGGDARVTTQSDVYGLGLLLAESLSGVRVVETEGKGLAEIVEQVLSGEPPALPGGARGPLGALDFIVRKALRKDPHARYDSAAALAEDLRRALRGDQPLGRTLDALDALGAFVARNRRAFAIGSLVAIGGAIAVGFGASQYLRAREAEARSGVLVGGLLEGARPLLVDLHTRLLAENQPLAARKAALEKTVAYLEWVDANAGDDRRVLAEIARIYRQLGLVAGAAGQGSLGDTDTAVDAYGRCRAILDRLLAERADKALLLLRASVLRDYAGLLPFDDRAAYFALAADDQRAALALTPEGAERDANERFLLTTEVQTARLAVDLARIGAPLARLREMVSQGKFADDGEFWSEYGLAERYGADLLEEAGRYEEAVACARLAADAFDRSSALGLDGFTNNRHLSRIECLLACRTAADRPPQASLELLLSALERSRRATNLKPRDSFHRIAHIESLEVFGAAAQVVAEHALAVGDAEGARAVAASAIAAIDEGTAFAQSLPTEGAPHVHEPRRLKALAEIRRTLEANTSG